MEIKKIYIIASAGNQYGVIDEFNRGLSEAFNRHGVISRIYQPQFDSPGNFLDELLKDPPDCTISFNGILPDSKGHFLCDLVKIPHLALLTDPPIDYFPLTKSPRTIIGCVDQDFCQVFRDMGFDHVLFVPHAVNRDLFFIPEIKLERNFDVLVLNSFIDYEEIRDGWKKKYSAVLCNLLEEAAEIALGSETVSYIQAFISLYNELLSQGRGVDPKDVNFSILLDELESYISGKGRVEFLRGLPEVKVDIFGKQSGEGWKKYLGPETSFLSYHPPVPFFGTYDLMRRAKVVVNHAFKRGFHERLLTSLACGALPISMGNPLIRKEFIDSKEILLYQSGVQGSAEIIEKLEVYLKNEKQREEIVKKGREKVLKNHTWDQRVEYLKRYLPPLLEKIESQLVVNASSS